MRISQYRAPLSCCFSLRILNVVKYVFILLTSSTATFAVTIVVPAGGDLQSAINSAAPGDTITLQAGATYTGPFFLTNKNCDSYITIQSSRANEINGRVSPSQSGLLARLSYTGAEPVIRTVPGAHHYKLIGLEISTFTSSDFIYDLVRLGASDSTQTDLSAVPHHLILDRLWIHGFETQRLQRGISLNSAETSILNSYISDIHEIGIEAQAICSWNGPGPFTITNNYLEAATENVMFGGSPPSIQGLVPSNITITQNHFFKPLSWKVDDPTYAGIHWGVKNLLELKNARNVVIEGNIFENNWTDAQAGRSIVFTPRQSDSGPAAVIEDVLFRNNIVRNVGSGMNVSGRDDGPTAVTTLRRVRISNNVFLVDGPRFGSNGVFLTIINGTESVTVDHNTAIQTGDLIAADYAPNTGFIYRENIARHNEFGIMGSGSSPGNATIAQYFPGAIITNNAIVKEFNSPGNVESIYPAGNLFPATLSLAIDGSFRSLISGVGCDIDVLNAAINGTNPPAPSPAPSPSPSPTPVGTPIPGPTPTPTPTSTQNVTVQFNPASYAVNEDIGSLAITVTRDGDTAGSTTVQYVSSNENASSRTDYNGVSGTLTFAPGETSKTFNLFINDDVYIEGNETLNLTLKNASNATLGGAATAAITIRDNDTTAPTANPLDNPVFFVRQHYVDFFNREPDAAGLQFWVNEITSCGADAACAQRRRINILEAFYLSIEFQESACLVYRTYAAALGQNRLATDVPLTLDEFQSDTQRVGKGIIVNAAGWQNALEANKVAYFNDFVTRPAFTSLYPSSLSNAAFIDALNTNTQGVVSSSLRSQLLADLDRGTKTRAQALRAVVESQAYVAREMNKAFVLLEYFGYLRRNPNEFPDVNFDGYGFWLSKLNVFSGSFVNAEMVKAFIESREYRTRFGPP